MSNETARRVRIRTFSLKVKNSEPEHTEVFLSSGMRLMMETSTLTKPTTKTVLAELRKEVEQVYRICAFLVNKFSNPLTECVPDELNSFELTLRPCLGTYDVRFTRTQSDCVRSFIFKFHPADGKNVFLRKVTSPVRDATVDHLEESATFLELL